MRGKTAIRNRWVSMYSAASGTLSENSLRSLAEAGIPLASIDMDPATEEDSGVMAANGADRPVLTVFVRHILVEPDNHLLDDLLLTPGARTVSCTIYSTTWCPDCHRSKAWFATHNMPYEDVDIETTDGAVDIVRELSGGLRSVPTIDITMSIADPTDEALTRLLGL